MIKCLPFPWRSISTVSGRILLVIFAADQCCTVAVMFIIRRVIMQAF
jgi:hypothetical protein